MGKKLEETPGNTGFGRGKNENSIAGREAFSKLVPESSGWPDVGVWGGGWQARQRLR